MSLEKQMHEPILCFFFRDMPPFLFTPLAVLGAMSQYHLSSAGSTSLKPTTASPDMSELS